MSRVISVLMFCCFIGACASQSTSDLPIDSVSGLPIHQPLSEISVELFAPGVVNSTWPEFGITFSAAGDTAYFTRTIKDRTKATIMRSLLVDGVWQDPEVAPFSGPTFDVDPFIMVDGSVFYSSLQFDVERDSLASFDFWIWPGSGNPVRLPRPLNSDQNESFMTGASDGTLYFGSARSGSAQIYVSNFADGIRQDPQILPIPELSNPGNPLISPNGNTMVLVSEVPDGTTQLSFMCLEEGTWSSPILLPEPINSSYLEYAPGIDPEGLLYFASERPGMLQEPKSGEVTPSDIYRSTLKIDSLCEVK